MQYRIIDKQTGKFITEPTTITEASKYRKLLNLNSGNKKRYIVVAVEKEKQKNN